MTLRNASAARGTPAAARGTAPLDRLNDSASDPPLQVVAQRAPAYGRRLAELRLCGLAPTSAVLIVDGWAPVTIEAEHAPWVLVVPEQEPPWAFHFRVVAGLFVYIISNETARADAIVAQVERYSPKGIFSWAADADLFTIHVRGAQ